MYISTLIFYFFSLFLVSFKRKHFILFFFKYILNIDSLSVYKLTEIYRSLFITTAKYLFNYLIQNHHYKNPILNDSCVTYYLLNFK